MNITLAILPHPSLKDNEIQQWENEHPDAKSFTSFAEALETSEGPSLFHESLGWKIFIDEVTANEFRMFMNDCDEDTLVITTKSPRANFAKDGVKIINNSIPKNDKEAFKLLAKKFDVDINMVKKIAMSVENDISKIDKIEQYSYIDNPNNYSYGDLYDIKSGDNPPWDITDAIISGNSSLASKNAALYMSKSTDKNIATSLMFQILGYFRKVMSAKNDKGKIVDNKQFFQGKSKKIKNELGLAQDMSYYSNVILNNTQYDKQVLCCMVASMAERFRK